MPRSSKTSVWKEIKYWTFTFVALAFLFEMISSMVFRSRYVSPQPAIVHLASKFFDDKPDPSFYHKVHEMVRPDSSAEANKQIADEIWAANKYGYEPWLQFRVIDFNSKYVNISGFKRKSIPEEFINPNSDDTIDVFFFGGSTMYGYNATDKETIPSQFIDIYKSKYPQGKSIRVHNYGVPYYYSKQELMLLTRLITEGKRPNIVAFLDGLNDFYPSRMLYYDRTHFSYALQQVFDDQVYHKKNRPIIDSSDQYYIDVPGMPAKEYYHALMTKYLRNVHSATSLSNQVGAKSYFFCQPVPFYNYPNRKNDPISYKVNYDRYDYIYPLLDKAEDTISNFSFLGNMLQDEKGLPFVDQVHYSPVFLRKIAQQIFDKIDNDKILN